MRALPRLRVGQPLEDGSIQLAVGSEEDELDAVCSPHIHASSRYGADPKSSIRSFDFRLAITLIPTTAGYL
jgi:hypothetical protein